MCKSRGMAELDSPPPQESGWFEVALVSLDVPPGDDIAGRCSIYRVRNADEQYEVRAEPPDRTLDLRRRIDVLVLRFGGLGVPGGLAGHEATDVVVDPRRPRPSSPHAGDVFEFRFSRREASSPEAFWAAIRSPEVLSLQKD